MSGKQRGHTDRHPFTLALGGGGARGLAHVGVLKALERHHIHPACIVGTSMGALVGAMYAELQNADAVERKIRDFLIGEFFQRIGLEQFADSDADNSHSLWDRFAAHLKNRYYLSRSAFGIGTFARESLAQGISMLLGDVMIEHLPVRFASVASDLVTGEEAVFTKGPLVPAVAASCAVLGIVAPFPFDHRQLVDGTVTSTIPVPAARKLSRDPIVAVDVRQSLGNVETYEHGYEVYIRASEITRSRLNDVHLKSAALTLVPAVGGVAWNQFSRVDECIRKGELAVEQQMEKLERIIRKKRFGLFRWK